MLPELNHAQLVAFARPMVGADEAEDVVQAAYVKMLSTKTGFRGDAAKQTWACAIVRRVALDRLRQLGRALPVVSLDTLLDHEADTSRWEPAAPAVDRIVALDAQRQVAALTPAEQLILTSAHETDRTLAARWGVARHQVVTARARLRKKLETP